MDEELIGQLREISGSAVVTCDLCGLPGSATAMVVVDGRRGAAEPVEQLRLCASCRQLMEADGLPVGLETSEETALPD